MIFRWRWWRLRWPTGPYLGPHPPGRASERARRMLRELGTVALFLLFVGVLMLVAWCL